VAAIDESPLDGLSDEPPLLGATEVPSDEAGEVALDDASLVPSDEAPLLGATDVADDELADDPADPADPEDPWVSSSSSSVIRRDTTNRVTRTNFTLIYVTLMTNLELTLTIEKLLMH